MPDEEIPALLIELARLRRSRLSLYDPYDKQLAFHAAGEQYRERLLRAGTQNGKSFCGGCEMAYHLTGQYPEWWPGRRFDRAIVAWASGLTGEMTRENVQKQLLGPLGEWGTGSIPANCLIATKPARGAAGLLDYVKVKHVTGGESMLRFKYYEQGREKWQGPGVDVVWFDEEPPAPIYDEGLSRTVATGGMAYLTFTPLLGMSEVVKRFLRDPTPDRHDTNMTIEDALHIPKEERASIIAAYPLHEREARARGTPILGSGLIFPVAEEMITCEPMAIPATWKFLGAMDFGYDHPFAAVALAYDADADCVYVIRSYRAREQTPIMHAGAIRAWGMWMPWAWPADGLQHQKDSGEALAPQYTKQGLLLLPDRATFDDGGDSVEAGLMDMLDRMLTGRLKIFSHLQDIFSELRLYHRKDGKIVKTEDDLIDAIRYGIMMIRFAIYHPKAIDKIRHGNTMHKVDHDPFAEAWGLKR